MCKMETDNRHGKMCKIKRTKNMTWQNVQDHREHDMAKCARSSRTTNACPHRGTIICDDRNPHCACRRHPQTLATNMPATNSSAIPQSLWHPTKKTKKSKKMNPPSRRLRCKPRRTNVGPKGKSDEGDTRRPICLAAQTAQLRG